MKNKLNVILLSITIIGAAGSLISCKDETSSLSQPQIAVANSYIGAVVKDLCGNQPVFDLVPPGMCPGHFDISPSQVNMLCHCKILFVFDFQKNIEKAIPRIKERGLEVCIITPSPGMCMPETYLSIAKQVGAALSQQQPSQKAHYEARLKEIEQRLEKLSQNITARIKESGLQARKIMTSKHQAEFAKWLGLDCVSTFAGRDTITPAQIDDSLQDARKNHVELVIANKQEGTEMAGILTEHLNVKYTVFSNFPDSHDQNAAIAGYDALVNNNVNGLIEAMR